jgi:cytochrome c-type biogenesis protein CcmH
MTAFVVAAVVIAALALALLVRPLWTRRGAAASRRDLSLAVHRDQLRELDADLAAGTLAQSDYDRARMEVEKRALEEAGVAEAPAKKSFPPRAVAAVAVALPLLAIVVYLAVGNLRALDPRQVAAAQPGMRDIEAMVQQLADRLEKNPDDTEGWKMLGRSYSVMARYPEAVRAYSRAAAKAPRDADLLAELADALAMARGQNLQGEPEELVLRALQIDPKNLKALALAGTAAFGREDFGGAVRHWSQMLAEVPAGSEDARAIQANIDEAKAMAAQNKKPGAQKKSQAMAALTGTVSISPKLAGQVSPDDTVFIFARATDGPPMPLAAVRRKVRDLPYAFRLDDSMAMTPAAKLSGQAKVMVVARVSKSGTATAQRGDLQGASAAVANDARGVAVVIDSVVP